MEYCEYCRERRGIIEIDEDKRICPHSPNGQHYFVTAGYEAGYAFGGYVVDKIIAIFRSLFNRK